MGSGFASSSIANLPPNVRIIKLLVGKGRIQAAGRGQSILHQPEMKNPSLLSERRAKYMNITSLLDRLACE